MFLIFMKMISRQLYILLFLFFFVSCKKDPSLWEIRNLNGNTIGVFGHGGMGIHYNYPMNSFESLSRSIGKGVDGVEMDVCVTKDSVLMLSHDQDLSSGMSCSGLIKTKLFSEISNCKYNSPLFSKADLIPASYFFDRKGAGNTLFFTFDCKVELDEDSAYLEKFASALVRHIERYGIVSRSFIESFNLDFLKMLHSRNKDLHLFLYTPDYKTGLAASKDLPLYGLTLDQENISAAEIADAHANNLRVALFNTRTERENLEAIAKSPDYIQTDKVDHLIHALKE